MRFQIRYGSEKKSRRKLGGNVTCLVMTIEFVKTGAKAGAMEFKWDLSKTYRYWYIGQKKTKAGKQFLSFLSQTKSKIP